MGKKKDTAEILGQIAEYIGSDGCVAFEHGYRYPSFKIEGYVYKCTMVTSKVMYGYKYYPITRERRTCNYPLSFLNYSVLNRLMYHMKKYEEFCKKEA